MKGTSPASARPVAKPTMFCSATPTLKNLPGKASEKGSSAMKPRSAVSSTTRGSRSASSTRARMKDLRMASVPYFRERRPVLLIVHRHVVPADLALHERHALAERRVGNEDVRRPSRQAGHRARSEEHTSELQSPCNLVCRLLLEKKKKNQTIILHQKKKKKQKT